MSLKPSPNMSLKPMILKPIQIRQVWSANLFHEFNLIKSILHRHPFISMDTEFPGAVYRPEKNLIHNNLSPTDHYKYLKANVDVLKLIQVGLTLSDAYGNLPDFGTDYCYIWEFNFCDFDISEDMYAADSIELLKRQGIDFKKNKEMGIESAKFAELMVRSRLVCNCSSVTWITFDSSSDIAYLVKILSGGGLLPYHLSDFMKIVEGYFGLRVYDIKHIMKFCHGLYGGLERVSKTLDVDREVGKCHQAGSDSLLTLKTFMKIKEKFNVSVQQYGGVICGLGHIKSAVPIAYIKSAVPTPPYVRSCVRYLDPNMWNKWVMRNTCGHLDFHTNRPVLIPY